MGINVKLLLNIIMLDKFVCGLSKNIQLEQLTLCYCGVL